MIVIVGRGHRRINLLPFDRNFKKKFSQILMLFSIHDLAACNIQSSESFKICSEPTKNLIDRNNEVRRVISTEQYNAVSILLTTNSKAAIDVPPINCNIGITINWRRNQVDTRKQRLSYHHHQQ